MKPSVPTDLSPPALLRADHDLSEFDCGNNVLNKWLQQYAWQNQQANAAKTFVVSADNRVIAYYSLAVGAIEHSTATARTKKGLARHPIPVMILARLAVDLDYQRRRIGSGLLKDAILRTLLVAEHAGIRAIFVHAKDDAANHFYRHYGFESSPIDHLKLMLLIKDARKTISFGSPQQ